MLNIILGTIGSVMVIMWFVLFIGSGSKYQEHIAALDGDEYFLKDLYGIGYQFIKAVGIDINDGYFQKTTNRL